MVFFRITSRVRNDNAVGYLLYFSQHSFECSILRHLVFKKTLGTAQCLTTYQVVLGHSGFEGVSGTEVIRAPI